MIDVIIAPESAAQTLPTHTQPPLLPHLDRLDRTIVETVRDCGLTKIWPVLNTVADGEAPRNRSEGRAIRLHLLGRLQRLNRLGLVFLTGRNLVSPVKTDPDTVKAIAGRRRPTARKSTRFWAVSANSPVNCTRPPETKHPVQTQASNFQQPVADMLPKTKNAPTAAQITAAAQALARLPRRIRKKWTGLIKNRRGYRDQRVILPTGEVAYIFGVLRGKVVATLDRGQLLGGYFGGGGPMRWTVVPAGRVTVYQCPEAQLLGHLKVGRREKSSELKAATARKNGRCPCKDGRRRGRPELAKFTQRQRPEHIRLWSV